MKALAFSVISALLALGSAVPAQSADAPAPVRHLVYDFTLGISNTNIVHDEGTGQAVPYRGGNSDKGTITVDVTGVSGDGGLVVRVSEEARETRSAKPSTCAVYGNNLSVICADIVNDEERAIVRLIGRDFIAPGMSAVNSHWTIPGNVEGGSQNSDFMVKSNQNGLLTIDEQVVAKVRGANPYDATTNGTITYDATMTVPKALHEMLIRHDLGGPGGQNTVNIDTELTLVSDSMAAKH